MKYKYRKLKYYQYFRLDNLSMTRNCSMAREGWKLLFCLNHPFEFVNLWSKEHKRKVVLLAENGNETEAIWFQELQRIAGADVELSSQAQTRLHQLRISRYEVTSAY